MFKKLTLTALVVIFSGATIAADSDLYKKIDTDNDGTINKEEASVIPILSEKWIELDENTDGKLDQAEFAKFETMSD